MNKPVLCLIAVMFIFSSCGDQNRKLIRDSLSAKLESYPESTLQDLYKSYFQDYFGPGHMISDTAAARKYLEYELNMDDYSDTVLLEKTGYRGNFYRVNLLLVKEGVIPKDLFLKHFIESVNSVQGISIEEWKREWAIIISEAEAIAGEISSFDQDKAFIDSLLNSGNYVVHHSEKYLEAYHPHYRIIHREIFDTYLSEYLR